MQDKLETFRFETCVFTVLKTSTKWLFVSKIQKYWTSCCLLESCLLVDCWIEYTPTSHLRRYLYSSEGENSCVFNTHTHTHIDTQANGMHSPTMLCTHRTTAPHRHETRHRHQPHRRTIHFTHAHTHAHAHTPTVCERVYTQRQRKRVCPISVENRGRCSHTKWKRECKENEHKKNELDNFMWIRKRRRARQAQTRP